MSTAPHPIGRLAAQLLLRRSSAQSAGTSHRHLIDHLPEDVAELLFDGLMELVDSKVPVRLPRDEGGETTTVSMSAIGWNQHHILPFLVQAEGSARPPSPSCGTDAYASCLRDHFAVDAELPRKLVVIAPAGVIETQRSAQDTRADRALIDLDLLLSEVLNDAGVPADDALRAVVPVYLAHLDPHTSWLRAAEKFDAYVKEVADQPAEVKGEKLTMLGCFLRDPTPGFVGGPSLEVLEASEQRRRDQGLRGRLAENAALFNFLQDVLKDPLNDPEQRIAALFDDGGDQAKQIAKQGVAGLQSVSLAQFNDAKQRRARSKNSFASGDLVVTGANLFRQFQSGDELVLVVAASHDFQVKVGLKDPFNGRKAHAQSAYWHSSGRRPTVMTHRVADGATEVTFPVSLRSGGNADFFIARLALSPGPRSLRYPLSVINVVVYRTAAAEVLVEESRKVSLEDQAWISEGSPLFDRYTLDGSESATLAGEPQRLNGGDDNDDEDELFQVSVEGSKLAPRVVLKTDRGQTDAHVEDPNVELTLELCCTTHKLGHPTTLALREGGHYLDNIVEIHEGGAFYKIDLRGGLTRKVQAHHSAETPLRNGQAVAALLHNPNATRVELHEGIGKLVPQLPPEDEAPTPALQTLLRARSALLSKLSGLAEKVLPRYRRAPMEAAVPVMLLAMAPLADEIEALLNLWIAAFDGLAKEAPEYGPWHELLLQLDTLHVYDAGGALKRVVLLPTHPWMLGALRRYQERSNLNIRRAKPTKQITKPWIFELSREEVEQEIPRAVIEDWYVWHNSGRVLRASDAPPFHLEFTPTDSRGHVAPLDYVTRVIANKISRYLRMHPHLNDKRRTLRIGFVNPGGGRHLLDGLIRWLRDLMPDRIRELPDSRIPSIDLHLFAPRGDENVGAEIERFFHAELNSNDEDVIRQTLIARTRYRFTEGEGPKGASDFLHLCFVHGLVNLSDQQCRTGALAEWWDGGFGDGAMATYMRRTARRGPQNTLVSSRGLWIDSTAEGMRGALGRMLALQRGCRDNDLRPDRALFWETTLPDLQRLQTTYDHSDWVVHLDRELSLEIFKRRGVQDSVPTIIEYSDQEVPESPGFDTITATRNAGPYQAQLGEILKLANLDLNGRSEEARRSANVLLDDINALSGAWALDFLMGSIADERAKTRLKGNVGVALVYRWLRRVEQRDSSVTMLTSNVGEVAPVYISLEDLLRVTPSHGLRQRDGLASRFADQADEDETGEKRSWCDDLLVLYITPSVAGSPSRIFGRVIEVKFGSTAQSAKDKAIAQVKGTHKLLQERLSGDKTTLNAPYRDKQLSLLIKAQLEQGVAMGLYPPEIYDRLNVAVLSTNLATGNYMVDYTLHDDEGPRYGDVFLLTTEDDSQDRVERTSKDGVRVISLSSKMIEWLAFVPEDARTLTERPVNTLPFLGKAPAAPQAPQAPQAPPPPAAKQTLGPPSVTPTSADRVSGPANPRVVVTESPPQQNDVDTLTTNLAEASATPVKAAPYADQPVVDAVTRLERALSGHKVRLSTMPSAREVDRGPRLLRVYVRLDPGESITAIRRISEDIARVVGTSTSDIHIMNVPERHAVGLDLPLSGLTYSVSMDELMAHPSFEAAQRELTLGFCAGIDVTGRPQWVDLAGMPHMLVAGTTGSGKTVFLRNIILTLLLNNSPRELTLRLSSSKPMDFRVFTQAPHAAGREMARDPLDALRLANELIEEMERRYGLLDESLCDNLAEHNRENPGATVPYIVAVFDEYAEMISSFAEKQDRESFESAIGRLAQKARAAGIHLIVCMQRPDVNAIKGAIKSNIAHRFALKLPQSQDSRVILDENGAETLLGQGDLLYKDSNNRITRLQVPFLEGATLKRHLQRVLSGSAPRAADPALLKTCPKCGATGPVAELFGMRRTRHTRKDGVEVSVERPQSYCRSCRGSGAD